MVTGFLHDLLPWLPLLSRASLLVVVKSIRKPWRFPGYNRAKISKLLETASMVGASTNSRRLRSLVLGGLDNWGDWVGGIQWAVEGLLYR